MKMASEIKDIGTMLNVVLLRAFKFHLKNKRT